MKIGKSGLILWELYCAFALYAVTANMQETTFQFSGTLGKLTLMSEYITRAGG